MAQRRPSGACRDALKTKDPFGNICQRGPGFIGEFLSITNHRKRCEMDGGGWGGEGKRSQDRRSFRSRLNQPDQRRRVRSEVT